MRNGVMVAGVIVVGFVVVMMPFWTMLLTSLGMVATRDSGCAIEPKPTPGSSPVKLDAEQLKNAAAIVAAATSLKLPSAAAVLGVQCAYGESNLRVIDYGDAAGPDSRGLFQQRDNGAWGSYADRMDPKTSALNFFKALQMVSGWEKLEPSLAINRVQRNSDPGYYAQYRAIALAAVSQLGGDVSGAAAGQCQAGGQVIGSIAGKWVNPLPGAVITSPYGPRPLPPGTSDGGGVLANFHYGMDLSTGGGTTVLAPTDLKIVIAKDLDGGFGTRVDGQTLDGKLTIGMYHMQAGSLKVAAGDTVAAGTPLGVEGATGNVTGPHTHIEFFVGRFESPYVPTNPTTDPQPIFASKGIKW